MKALIICNDDDVFIKMEKVLKDAHYETIRYKHLLKALDNVEEIQSDVVIISALDYPRHWKTFTQYAKSGVTGKVPKVVLYTPSSLSDEDKKKASDLVSGTFSSCSDEELEKLLSILLESEYTTNFSNYENSEEDSSSASNIQSLIFSHPKSNFIITGTVSSSEENYVQFIPDYPTLVSDIQVEDVIQKVSYKKDSQYKICSAVVKESEMYLTLELGI